MRYTGQKCSVCENVFDVNDDVVVCPDCGAPQHRDCYFKNGSCGFCSGHGKKEKWSRDDSVVNAEEIGGETKKCPVCGSEADAGTFYCENCGNIFAMPWEADKLPDNETFRKNFRTLFEYDTDQDLDGVKAEDIVNFVGFSSVRYMRSFKKMKDMNSDMSCNFKCLLFPNLYFANRRMWGWAIIATLLLVLLSLPNTLIYFISDGSGKASMIFTENAISMLNDNRILLQRISNIFFVIDCLVRITFFLFGNSIYYRHVIRTIKKIKSRPNISAMPEIRNAGGTRPFNIITISVVTLILSYASVLGMSFIFELLFVFLHGVS